MTKQLETGPGFSRHVPDKLERRRFGRRDACQPAVILTAKGDAVRCLIINKSDGGAALRVTGDVAVTKNFLLVIDAEDSVTSCRLVHRTGDRIGVEYVSLSQRASVYFQKARAERRMEIRMANRP